MSGKRKSEKDRIAEIGYDARIVRRKAEVGKRTFTNKNHDRLAESGYETRIVERKAEVVKRKALTRRVT